MLGGKLKLISSNYGAIKWQQKYLDHQSWKSLKQLRTIYFAEYTRVVYRKKRANLWHKCKNNFKLEDGILYYRKAIADGESCALWRICVKTEEDRQEENNGVLPCWIGRQVQIADVYLGL